ncbi:MAG: hypothetical protein HY744_04940 [Deltaproteobacteria bacterium]|nr:hypothetical protein [Deltaproteobacteria bacterium]
MLPLQLQSLAARVRLWLDQRFRSLGGHSRRRWLSLGLTIAAALAVLGGLVRLAIDDRTAPVSSFEQPHDGGPRAGR